LIVARQGNEVEIRGMLDLAEVKGWEELTFTGSEAFKQQAMAAALDRGLRVRAEGRDAELLREAEALRNTNRSSITREMEHTRDNDGWER
ncbi:MAG: LPD7 domain-containing protein, partial [Candidatus Baltobacteraceae bacterium]